MKKNLLFTLVLLILASLFFDCSNAQNLPDADWTLGPFVKQDAANPCLLPDSSSIFFCPLQQDTVYWERKDVFNPAAVIHNDLIILIYRAEDVVGKLAGTSRLGVAWSNDGLKFTKFEQPVLFPQEDKMKQYEWEGGIEDPRVIQDLNGVFYLTYTAWDGKYARICVASSLDLFNWTKHGLAFEEAYEGKYKDVWSKSGSIVSTMLDDGRTIAYKIDGKYWMYWGDTDMFLAWSEDLLNWTPVEATGKRPKDIPKDGKEDLLRVFRPRSGKFDSRLVEPGPPAFVTEQGIVLIYNSMNKNDPELPDGTYTAGQVLLDKTDPSKVLARTDSYFFKPDKDYEITGQVNNVTFLEGLVKYKGQYFLYYGTADSKIAVAVMGTEDNSK